MTPRQAAQTLRHLGLEAAAAEQLVQDLVVLAAYKYDEYGGYRPGVRFLGTFLRWLEQFAPQERAAAAAFVRHSLLFFSTAEMDHLVDLVYPTLIRPGLLQRASLLTGVPAHLVSAVTSTTEFRALHRATLVLGLSDGARIDQLRRATPALRDDQFLSSTDLTEERLAEMLDFLAIAQRGLGLPSDRHYRHVVLVDDFSVTGTTLLRRWRGDWDGRLWHAHGQLTGRVARLALGADHSVRVVLYVATQRCLRTVRRRLQRAGITWPVDALFTLPDELADHTRDHDVVRSSPMRRLPPSGLPLGCGDGALPLVLQHNAPDNSIALLWQDRPALEGHRVVPLFPRYERFPIPPAVE